MARNIDTATPVLNAQAAYLAAKAECEIANELSKVAWAEFTEDEIDGWSEEEFTAVSEAIEAIAGTIPTMHAERAAARIMVQAVRAHIANDPKTRRDYRTSSAMMETLFTPWENLASSRERMIALCLKLAV